MNHQEIMRKYERGWSCAHIGRMRGVSKQCIDQIINRPKLNSRQAVEYALERGKIEKRPREKCGSLEVQAHHVDYSKPLEIIWLCIEHHKEAHKNMKYKTTRARNSSPKRHT